MGEELQLMLNDDGKFEEYDNTYDFIIHCESKEEQEEILNRLNRRWIPVSERLPNKDGRYLVTVKQGYITFGTWVGVAENWMEVIAWIPLPEPYKAESEAGNGRLDG